MKRRMIYCVAMLLALLLCAAIPLGAALPAAAEEENSLDFGLYGRENNTEYRGADLYRYLFEKDPTNATAEYLDQMGITFGYNSAIPASAVSTDYDGEEGVLSITVRPYQYTATNGATVTWLPTTARVDGKVLELTPEGDHYTGHFGNLFRSEDFEMEVDYSWSVTVPKETVTTLRNEAYLVGKAAYDAMAGYEEELEAYQSKVDAYNTWQTYLTNKAAYTAYCEALASYNEQLAAYDAYREARSEYIVKNAAYEQWQKYYEKVREYEAEYSKYTAYQNYLASMATVEAKLALMDYIYVSDSRRWSLRGAIMGSTVTEVINRKDELVDVLLCSEEDVNLAGDSTVALRELITGYDPLYWTAATSGYQGTAKRYAYFSEHYEELKLHFTNLYMSLSALLENTSVEQVLDMEGKREHYLQLIGQLYVISTCLDESGQRDDSKWKIVGFRLGEIVEPIQILADGDWDPRVSPMPAYAEEAACPAPVKAPSVARPDRKPIAPEAVEHPGTAPAAVADPDEGGIPERVESYPASPPMLPDAEPLSMRLAEEVRNGTLKKYNGPIEDMELSFSKTLLRNVSITNQKTVIFHDIDGTVLDTVSVNYGGRVYKEVPEHALSPAYTYRTLGWVGADGETVDLSLVVADIDVYPHYEMTQKIYTVTWRIKDGDGVVTDHTARWSYGSIPKPGTDVPCRSYDTYGYAYQFSGWNQEIGRVTGDVTYVGEFQRITKKFAIHWEVGENVTTEMWEYGSIPSFSGETAIVSPNERCTFLGFSPEIEAVKGEATYTALYERKPYAIGGVSEPLPITTDQHTLTVLAGEFSSVGVADTLGYAAELEKGLSLLWENGCKLSVSLKHLTSLRDAGCTRIVLQSFESDGEDFYELRFYDNALREIQLEEGVTALHLPHREFEDGKRTAFFLCDVSGEETRIEQGSIPAFSGVTVRLAYAYPLRVQHNPLCNTMALDADALIGSTVSLNVTCDTGYEITGIEVKDADGNTIVLDGYSFVMPESAVDVSFVVEPIVYHVVFKSEGKVLLEKTYGYGEKLEIPPNPHKEGDDRYVYNFVSWGKNVPVILTGDEHELVFEAQFIRAIRDVNYDTGNNNNLLVELVLPCVLGGLALIGGGIATVTILRRKKKRKTK